MTNLPDEPKIVVIGGGTGLSVLLKGLKRYSSQLTAVVTVSDDGGSSGRLRAELGVLPPGDIRNCLVALAETETIMDEVFQHRFCQGSSLQGHNLGNLLLVALTEITGDFVSAIKEVSKVLAVRGKVIPATLEHVMLGAIMKDGVLLNGETCIRSYSAGIEQLFLVPDQCMPVPETLNSIMEADAIVLGPGSLYTSIIPNLLVKGIGKALADSTAKKIYVSNIMTEQGETDKFTASDHLQVIMKYVEQPIIDYIVVNNGNIDENRLKRYQSEEAVPVIINPQHIAQMGITMIEEDLVSDSPLAWHDSDKLARVILKIINHECL
ncbi:MAG: YvcK family protein [Syntrophomonadaceae bacterium]|nr:YvcK family protein [Syntrophomonadaceae bacterium]MDD3023881.1 YvcK family protein [Syntrophomonadaceae bacterium]